PALASPPAAVVVALAVGVLDKDAVLLEQGHIGVVFQDAGLEVGDDVDPHLVHLVKEPLGIGEAAAVPVEHIAEVVLLAAGVARGQPEIVDQDALFPVLLSPCRSPGRSPFPAPHSTWWRRSSPGTAWWAGRGGRSAGCSGPAPPSPRGR